MYSEQLERLIQVCLADGVITEKEREVICKKAKSLGVDEDEVMVYVDGLLAEMQSKKKSSKEGEKHTCPNCGANIPAMVGKCPECGFEIRDNRASNAVTKFAEQYQSADVEKQISLVQSFPIPNNKEDFIEFASMAVPLATTLSKPPLWRIALPLLGLAVALSFVLTYAFGGLIGGLFAFYAIGGVLLYAAIKHGSTSHSFLDNKAEKTRKQEQRLNEELGKAWYAKLKQTLLKAKILSVSDPKFAAEMTALSNEFTKKEKRTILVTVIIWIIAIAIAVAYIAAPAEDRKARNEVFDDSEETVDNASDDYTTDSLYEDEEWEDSSDLDAITEDINMPEDN